MNDSRKSNLSRNSIAIVGIALLAFAIGCSNKPEVSGKKVTGKSNTTEPTKQTSNVDKKLEENSNNTSPDKPKTSTTKKPKPVKPDLNDPTFHEALLTASQDYLRFGMVNAIAQVAPEACAPATDFEEPRPLMSASDATDSHGQKLYFLFAKDIAHYMDQDGSDAPVGQTLVKESWTAKEANPNARNLRNHASGNRINPRATVGDKVMVIGKRNNFFVMTKLAVDTPNTDNGWVYGVIEPETKKVLAAGKVESCMECHRETENDRMFGPMNSLGVTQPAK